MMKNKPSSVKVFASFLSSLDIVVVFVGLDPLDGSTSFISISFNSTMIDFDFLC